MIIGSKIKEKRIALGLSQDELGKRLMKKVQEHQQFKILLI